MVQIQKTENQKFNNPITSFVYFSVVGLFALYINSRLELQELITVLLVLIAVLGTGLRFISRFFKGGVKSFLQSVGTLTIAFFVYLLISATGAISSPFLLSTHLFAIGASFLLSPQIAVSFILATIAVLIPATAADPSARTFLLESPLVAILYLVAYVSLIPISFALAKQYKTKEEWVNNLKKQIATSKTQEDALLKNIQDAVLVLNRKFEIMFLNDSITKLFKYTNHALGKNFFNLFLIKDLYGRLVESYNLPFAQILESKTQSYIENIQIASENQTYTRVDLKILPVIENNEALGLILVIKDLSGVELVQKSEKNAAITALSRFIEILNSQKKNFQQLVQYPRKTETIQQLITENLELEHLSQDFFYSLRLESGEIGSLSSLVDISETLEEVISEEKWQALERSIRIIPRNTTNELMIPRNSRQMAVRPMRFEKVYILANPAWLKDSLQRLLEIVILLSEKSGNIVLDVTRLETLARLTITAPIIIPTEDLGGIFEKFYPKLSNVKELSETSGLEGFIAKNLIERLGGHISIRNIPNSNLTNFEISFTLIENKPEEQPAIISAVPLQNPVSLPPQLSKPAISAT